MANVIELSIPESNSKIQVPTGLFINNEFVPSVDNLDPIRSESESRTPLIDRISQSELIMYTF